MSKITSYQSNILSSINKLQNFEQQVRNEHENVKSSEVEQDSVVSNLKPDLNSIEAANFIADKIVSNFQSSPNEALSAQGDLDEARILALLADDDE